VHAEDRAIAELLGPPVEGFPWWLPDLTAMVGPIRPGRFYVVGAMSKNGKTVFAANLLNGLMQGSKARVLFLSTELAAEEVWKWWASLVSAVPIEEVEDGKASPDQLARMAEAVGDLARQYRHGDPTTKRARVIVADGLYAPDIQQIAEYLDAFRPFDVLILDHVHRTVAGEGQSAHEHISEMAKWLKNLTLEAPVAVVCMAQLRRASANERISRYLRPYMEQLAWSGELERNADVVVGLSRVLREIDGATRSALLRGDLDPEVYADHGVMRMTCLAHRRMGSRMDRSVNAYLQGLRILPHAAAPVPSFARGDAWEPE
jgi:replicative DNA helicase